MREKRDNQLASASERKRVVAPKAPVRATAGG